VEVLELGAAEWLCEDVGGVFVTTDMLNPYVSLFHMVPYPMVRAVHMFHRALVFRVLDDLER
jgi:hypothetical protein